MKETKRPSFNYKTFESFFRGHRSEIKKRLMTYVPLLNLLSLDNNGSVLDIGCGRGEWLELLKEHDILATGIDLNHEFVDECFKMGLNAIEVDLFDFLTRQGDTKYVLITAFHFIEHICTDRLPQLLDSVFHLLVPGGAVILETPNPENITVGACNFYIDPTHQRPIPPQLLHFLALHSGFSSPLIARLNRSTVGAPMRMMAASAPGAPLYNQLLEIIASRVLQAPDYALIAFKPPSPTNTMLDFVAAINQYNDAFLLPAAPLLSSPAGDQHILQKRVAQLEMELGQIKKLLQQEHPKE